jgi:hypothetical protein
VKKLLIGGIVAGAALLGPTFASAQVIPGATYQGTFTTGTGGTVSLEVDGTGTTVDVVTEDFGQTGCDEASVTREDIPLSADSFNLLDPGPPALVSLTGFFASPGTVSGTARLSFACDSGTQSWSATTPVGWSDVAISAGGKTKGEDVYTQDGGPKPTLKRSAKKGKSARFKIGVGNDGTIDSVFNVKGCKAKAATYKSGGDNITAQVKSNDGYQPEIDAGEDIAVQLKYSAKGRPGSSKKCAVEANGDSVVAVTKIKKN